ncbi:60S ribosomal protein L7/L12 [Cyathus striatus]|nr:60S ribosomal protein L7/L12 [Cyathus striatus]
MASRCSGIIRAFSRQTTFPRCPRTLHSSRWLTTTTEPSKGSPSNLPLSCDPKLTSIVDDISGLTLLQAADLVTLLKSRLNIQEIAMPAAAPATQSASARRRRRACTSKQTTIEKPKEKTVFNVKLESFDAGSKPKIIREVKALVPNLTLIDAKKFVESLPKVLKENLSKEDAEALKKTFEGLGAVVKLD